MFKKIFKWTISIIAGAILLSVLWVVMLKFLPPPFGMAMFFRTFEYAFKGELVGMEKQWKGYDEISPNFFRAVIAAEDARFFTHSGFDWKAIDRAKRYNEIHKGRKKQGASTISMQTAKNTFLCHSRNYVRKGLEAYFTVLIEAIWGKKRILVMYANVVEFGKGVYGVEAASQKYFGRSAKDISKSQAALLAAVLPNPRLWNPAKPTKYNLNRQKWIQGRMGSISLRKIE